MLNKNDSSYNYITDPEMFRENKWVCNINFKGVNPILKQREMKLNLTTFTIPEQNLTTQTLSYQGAKMPIPGGVRDVPHIITLDYILDQELKSYKFLYDWFKLFADEIGAGFSPQTNGVLQNAIVPVEIILLSAFKNPLLSLKFEDAFISRVGELSMTYGSSEVVSHSFDLSYSVMRLV